MTSHNFVILYASREGSTAITNSLSGQSGIVVPVGEDLDAYCLVKGNKTQNIYDYLEEVFSTGQSSVVHGPLKNLQQRDQDAPVQSIGFKWRIFGNTFKIAKIFKKHDVTVFMLSRKNYLEFICSSYVHKYGNKLQSQIDLPTYPQFNVHVATGIERQELLQKMQSARFSLKSRWFLHTSYRRTVAKFHQLKRTLILSQLGVRVRPIYYEDFSENPEKFLRAFLKEINVPAQEPFNAHCDFVKVHDAPISSRIDGINKLISSPVSSVPYRFFKAGYNFFIRRIAALKYKNQ